MFVVAFTLYTIKQNIDKMKKSRMLLIASGLLSAAAAYYLRSENGQANVRSVVDKGMDFKNIAQSKGDQIVNEIMTTAQEVIESSIKGVKAAEDSVVSSAKGALYNIEAEYERMAQN